MYKITLFIILLFLPILIIAQRGDNQQYQALVEELYVGEAINTFDLREQKKYDHVFLNENWQESKLIFSDGEVSLRTFWLKYDILNQELNIRIGEETIYIVPKDRIRGFVFLSNIEKKILKETRFLISQKGKTKGNIYEVIIDGNYALAAFHKADKLKPNYIPALDTGNLSEKIVTKKTYFLVTNKKKIVEIPKKKRSAEKLFKKYAPARKYLDKNKVNFKKQKDLENLILFMNN